MTSCQLKLHCGHLGSQIKRKPFLGGQLGAAAGFLEKIESGCVGLEADTSHMRGTVTHS